MYTCSQPDKRLSLDDFNARDAQLAHEFSQVSNEQPRMRFTCWSKVRIDTEVDFYPTTLEPYATTLCEIRRLRNLRDFEQTRVKAASGVLLTCRHGELNVFDPFDFHVSAHE